MRGPMLLPVCGSASCFPVHVLVVCSRAGVYRLVCNHLNVAAGVLWDVCLCCLLLCHFLTAIVARQECAIACCWLLEWESPITMGPSAWLQLYLGCVCGVGVVGEQLSQAPLAVMAGNG